ncbi:MAG: alpha/beta fold hydrolase [Acidimicrobiales bacterium]
MDAGGLDHGKEHSFTSFDGTLIAYEVHAPDLLGRSPAVPRAPNRPVVLHHGFASDSFTNWVRPGVAAALTAAGRLVVAVDARGHGRSGKPHEPSAYACDAMVLDLRRLVDILACSSIDLVGYSMGAYVALGYALADRRLARLVLAGAGATSPSGRTTAGGPGPDQEEIAAALETNDPTTISSSRARAFRGFAEATGADRRALAAVQRAVSPPRSLHELAAISVPTLVLNGVDDTLAGPPDVLARAISSARWARVPGNHLSAVTKPEFAREVVDFLATAGSGDPTPEPPPA